ncbi:MAG: GntR family transcriptional regulator [Roseibium sp.]|uniref:GntR family transcriptional regulator n=1 Tax=Roseibium sp. TaxID=1936156 RepID=UPI00261B99C0|nr:GntR family transcriptional regulator [Roseibium sp.]MCV0427461.1 GntR family transcriptional regulator [Roseibium sp.]
MSETTEAKSTAIPIYETLKDEIVTSVLLPGEALRQDEIARRFGVSKIPVREALLKLEIDGFVLFRKNKGATVREMSSNEVLNLMDIRIALECKAIELSVPNMIPSDFARAEEILNDYSAQSDSQSWSEHNIAFHQTLYEPCDNPALLQMIADVRARLGPFTNMMVSEASGLERPHKEHQDILAACVTGNASKAVELLKQHIETTKKVTAAFMRRGARG